MLGNTQINVVDLRIHVHEMNTVNTKTGETEFQKQFQVILNFITLLFCH